jgi:hypothetical protein
MRSESIEADWINAMPPGFKGYRMPLRIRNHYESPRHSASPARILIEIAAMYHYHAQP